MPATPPETPLEQAARHVSEAEKRVERQSAILDGLVKAGHAEAADKARHVLRTLQTSLDLAREHLELERTMSR
ncbi:hypothetical protein [Azospirillum picis]|uniref:Uncharacterized protein n=1 Tax=Azospirillum picis TaxID=488438 RepID=A0ABU0MNE8_9PROT|nr:hypothetical protein [Azospirillum picis]MBP2301828.1 hypothetical protein [Azospirillum picis]MDQ0534997.1 hypothetical protein [Azospirillum picis]